jgi:hypothetical protein
MKKTASIRNEFHSNIDAMDEESLQALRPIFSALMNRRNSKCVIETDLTDEEIAIIKEGDNEFREHPERFISLEDFEKKFQEREMRKKKSRLKAKMRG